MLGEFLRSRPCRFCELLGLSEIHCTFMLAHRTAVSLLTLVPYVASLKMDVTLKVRLRKGLYFLDERLKELMQELGNAINESLSDSDRIAAAIGEIKRAGYDVFLVLEATIGFNKREEGEDEESVEAGEAQKGGPPGKIQLTSQDQKFLRALKIQIDEDSK
jgi:hypothetical protein